MTDPGIQPRQPWTRNDSHLPPDRAFFLELFERYLDEEAKREQRLRELYTNSMPTRWFWNWLLWSLAIGVIIGLVMALWSART